MQSSTVYAASESLKSNMDKCETMPIRTSGDDDDVKTEQKECTDVKIPTCCQADLSSQLETTELDSTIEYKPLEYIYSTKYKQIKSEILVLEYIGKNMFMDENGRKYLYEYNLINVVGEPHQARERLDGEQSEVPNRIKFPNSQASKDKLNIGVFKAVDEMLYVVDEITGEPCFEIK